MYKTPVCDNWAARVTGRNPDDPGVYAVTNGVAAEKFHRGIVTV
jgi:hypothetical protein